MRKLYSLGISAYQFSISLAARFSGKAQRWKEGRKNIFNKLEVELGGKEKPVWFHCASLGEFEQGRPLIEAYKKSYPKDKILLTFFSPSGYEVRKKYETADHVFYLPMDTEKDAKRFLSIVQPKMVFFIKYEFWFNYLDEIQRRKIPCYLVSGIFREDQIFFKTYGKWALQQLKAFSHFFLQNVSSAELLKKYGYNNISISGDTRFDRVVEIAKNARELPEIKTFCEGEFIAIFGSTWPEEDELAIQLSNKKEFGGKIIIAPHEINKEKNEHLLKAFDGKAILWSGIKAQENIPQAKVLIIDTIGLLSAIYRYGHISIIGGGFGKGVHNVLEAATFGMPILIGPNYHKFEEVKALVELGAAQSVESRSEFISSFLEVYQDDQLLREISALAKKYIQEKAGATEAILNWIGKHSSMI